MDSFDESGRSDLSSPMQHQHFRSGVKEGIMPALAQFGILLIAILEFVFIVGRQGSPKYVQQPVRKGNDLSDPSLIRLVYMFISLSASALLAVGAEKKSREGSDCAAFWLGSVGGTLLWQSLGECAWHFNIKAGEKSISLPRIDHTEGSPLFAVALALLVIAAKKQSFGFGTWTFYLNFMLIWLDHFIAFASYPLASEKYSENEWIERSGLLLGIPMAAASLYSIFFKSKDKKGRLMSSLPLYSSFSLISQGFGAYRK